MYKLSESQIQNVIDSASQKLFEYCRDHNIHYTVTGVSGGLDSAVTLGLAKKACDKAKACGYPLHSIGILLPCHSDPDHTKRGDEVIGAFEAERMCISLDEVYDVIDQKYLDTIHDQIGRILENTSGAQPQEQDFLVANGNIRARLRMMLGTYHTARLVNGIVLSTDNYSELLMGFWTICGDVGDFGMIQKVFKGLELYDIAKTLGVPESVLQAMPDDGLGITEGGDAEQLGGEYPTVDEIMIKIMQAGFDPDNDTELPVDIIEKIAGEGEVYDIDPDLILSLWKRSVRTKYKRKGTIILEREALGLPNVSEISL